MFLVMDWLVFADVDDMVVAACREADTACPKLWKKVLSCSYMAANLVASAASFCAKAEAMSASYFSWAETAEPMLLPRPLMELPV